MLFLLATPEYNNTQSNTTKVKVHLRNGVAEILDQHQDLMGKVENNLLEIETNFENKIEKLLFVLQDAVFIVSNKGLETNIESKRTGVYVYAKRVREITSSTSVEEIIKQYDLKNSQLETELAKVDTEGKSTKTTSKIFLLQEEVEFLKKVVTVIKDLKS
jgi:hypothetical protein